jgi:phage terminase small subunit
MARPRKPVAEHLKNGTYRADRHGPLASDDVPREAFAPPVKPAEMNSDAAAVWDRVIPLLAGSVRDRDSPLLAELCYWWAELERVTAVRDGMVPGEKGYNSILIASGICADKVVKLSEKFGLTPADRAKLKPEVAAGPAAAKVPTRPRTKLDAKGKPK